MGVLNRIDILQYFNWIQGTKVACRLALAVTSPAHSLVPSWLSQPHHLYLCVTLYLSFWGPFNSNSDNIDLCSYLIALISS